ncbi:hypothetical protein BTJ40_08090 [Microbulbifer sp. A4B17]|uniref:hypothetical protein n=1 Tax=Microbulbifer sp. A4B17 TaxID=359370 RepID=UPI000D52A9F3|nr:hypothetical protein [Microbulbifer sp. A4B17]AWF80771.1 hypothetical protein BTJ40_08090 [Microbulbifer sp. A4B17]
MSVSNSQLKLFLFLLALVLLKGLFFAGYTSMATAFVRLVVFPFMVAYFLTAYAFKYALWGWLKTYSILVLIFIFSESIDQILYFLKTGVSVFEDYESGSVSIFVLLWSMAVGFLVLLFNKRRFLD